MKNDLTKEELSILDFIIPHIPLKDRFYIRDTYFKKAIIPQYPNSYVIRKDGAINGHNAEAEKKNESLLDSYENVAIFLVENDFANRDKDYPRDKSLFLTEKGKMLVQYNTLNGYLGFELRRKHNEENQQLTSHELMQSQIDYFQSSIKNQEKQEELNDNQIQTNELTKITNVYVALFTGIAGIYYIYELLRNILPDTWKYKSFTIYTILTTAFGVGIFGYLRMHQANRKKTQSKS